MIKGSVLDQSPAQPGTPAVAEESMSQWMDYLHMQNATMINSPPTPKGVQVKLTATDSSGVKTDLGTVVTDGSGKFATMWTPTKTGLYTITADFAGSISYWSSTGETAIGVTAAAAPVVTPTTTPPISTASPILTPTIAPTPTPTTPQGPSEFPASTIYAISASIVIIAIIAIAAVILRRRK